MSHTVSKGLTKSVIAFRISWNSDLPHFQAGRFVLVAKNPIDFLAQPEKKVPNPTVGWRTWRPAGWEIVSWSFTFKTSFLCPVPTCFRSCQICLWHYCGRREPHVQDSPYADAWWEIWNLMELRHNAKARPFWTPCWILWFHALSAKAHELHQVLQHFRTLVCPRPESTSTVGLRFVSPYLLDQTWIN